jgi:3-dehydroquinate dehydratase-2
MTAKASTGVITGFGPFGYHMALISMHQILSELAQQKAAQKA